MKPITRKTCAVVQIALLVSLLGFPPLVHAALVDTDLQIRYYIDEAASGQGPTAVLDGSGVGADFDLTITYTAALNYQEISGNRGLESTAVTGTQAASKQIDNTSDKIRDNIIGAQKITVEVVVRIDDLSGSTGRIFCLQRSNDDIRFGFGGESGTELKFYWEEVVMRTIDPGTARIHLVASIDTTLATANDRIKIYIDDVLQSPTIDANPAQNDTLTASNSTNVFMLNRGGSASRGMDGVLFYAAMYSGAFSAANVTTNFDILTADDDTPTAGDDDLMVIQ